MDKVDAVVLTSDQERTIDHGGIFGSKRRLIAESTKRIDPQSSLCRRSDSGRSNGNEHRNKSHVQSIAMCAVGIHGSFFWIK
jgi:hypothetical protein